MQTKKCRLILALIIIFSFAACLLSSCASTKQKLPSADQLTLVERSTPQRPEWVNQPPSEGSDHLYFVGSSSYRSTDQKAREEALLVARRRFTEFAGVEVNLLEEIEHTTAGKGSEVLDTNVSGLSRVSQAATATISRLKIRQWYWERYRTSRRWGNNQSAFRCWVMVAAPKEELDRIQAQQDMQPWGDDGEETEEIHLQIKVGHQADRIFRDGENIPLSVSADRDCYLLLIYQDAVGNLIQLLPNRRSTEGFFSAGQAFRVPGRNDDFTFTVTEPFGQETLWGFASSQPFPTLSGSLRLDGTRILRNDIVKILNRLRVHGKLPGTIYGEARTMLTTAPHTDMTGERPQTTREVEG